MTNNKESDMTNFNLHGVDPKDYSTNTTRADTMNQDGAEGFDAKTGGHAKAGHANTSSFGAQPRQQQQVDQGRFIPAGLEEGGYTRDATSGIVVRNSPRHTESQPEPGVESLMTPLVKP